MKQIELGVSLIVNNKGAVVGEGLYTDKECEDYVGIQIIHKRWRGRFTSAIIHIDGKLITDVESGMWKIGDVSIKKICSKNISSNSVDAKDRKKSHAWKRALRMLDTIEKVLGDIKFI